jgi:Leucine-rich repeat (LRR) protein
MSKKISDNLIGKRYLLVLDDVWTKDQILWDQFMVHLKSGTPGSAILLTMCSSDVAGTVRSTYQFSLPFLSLGDSRRLFQQSLGMPVKHLESEFVEVGKEIKNKCGGVPLAIKVIAGVLRGKELIGEWQAMRDSNLLDVESEEASVSVSRCLMLSYFHLPSRMKQCFTICSVFPKGYMLDKEQLIDQWIAHDMITPESGVEYLEYIGHKYFNSLVQMSFLQDVAEDRYGRVECRMHDLVHDLALSIMGDEISFDVPNEATRTTKSYRYFSLIKRTENLELKNIFRKARIVYMPWPRDYTNFMELKHAKHLRSVTVGYADAKEANAISQVEYLKYLSMSLRSREMFPEGITDVWSLQALHVTQSYSILELPKSIGKLKKLRTLNLSGCKQLKHLPESIGDCQMISIIDLCHCEELTVLPDSIGRNKKLRVLRLSFTKIERLPSIITTLRNLECLDLQGCGELVDLPKGIGNMEKLQVLNLEDCKKLAGMPIGIGQLSRLQKLGLFVVGKGEKFARISELANVSRIGEKLIIRDIEHVIEPNDAHMACLKQKTNIQRLDLRWWMEYDAGKANTELEQAVLDGLEPPPRIKELKIHRYLGKQYARWMLNQVGGGVQGPTPFPFFRVLRLYDLPNLKNLHGLVELPCLEELKLQDMPSPERISGGPFPSLVKLQMDDLPCLGEVWMVAEITMPNGEEGAGCCNFTPQLGQLQVGNCLTELHIIDCPKLEVKTHLPPSLQHLHLDWSEQLLQSPGQCQGSSSSLSASHLKKLQLWHVTGLGSGHGWELLQHMVALESLEIRHFYGVQTELPESLWSLTSLRSLKVHGWRSCHLLPESLGVLRSLKELSIEDCDSLSSLPQSMGQLTSLQELVIGACEALHQLPDCLGELCSLRKLEINYLPGLTCLPQSICRLTTSLRELKINGCPGIKSLPEGIRTSRLSSNHGSGLP